jgi:hypothetical protein
VDDHAPGRFSRFMAAPKYCWCGAATSLLNAPVSPARCMAKSASPNTALYVAASNGKLTAGGPSSASFRLALTADATASEPAGRRNS